MPLDASIYNTQAPAPVNPLQTLGALQALNNAQQVGIGQQISNQRAKLGLSADQAALAMDQYNHLNKVIGDLSVKANSQEGITQNEMITEALNAKKQGIISTDGFNNFVGNLGEDTPQNNAATIAKLQYKIQDATKQHAITYGNPAQISNGAQQEFGVQQDPQYGGGLNVANTVANKLTPAEEAARVPTIDPKTNRPISIPQSQLVTPTGMPKLSIGTPENAQYIQDENDLRATVATPFSSKATPAPVILHTPQGALQTGFAPGEKESQERGSEMGDNLRIAADSVPQRKALLGELEGIVNSGDINLGPGSDSWKKVLAGVQRLYGGDSETVAKYDTFNKLATQLAQQQFQSLGGTGTDTKLGSAISASPNTSLSNKSNAEIIALLKGNEDAIAVKNKEWQTYKKNNGAGSYGDFSAAFNQVFDPRIFQAQHMTSDNRKAMLKGFSPNELAQYKQDYQAAGENGWIK